MDLSFANVSTATEFERRTLREEFASTFNCTLEHKDAHWELAMLVLVEDKEQVGGRFSVK